MKCQECELLLADDQNSTQVEEHLAECATCRRFSRELRANFEAMGEMRDEPLPVAPLRGWRTWAVAAAIVVGISLAHFWPGSVAPPPANVSVINPPPITRTIEAAPPLPIPHRRGVAVRKSTSEQQTLLVKMETDDPEVVIYWLVEPEKGQ